MLLAPDAPSIPPRGGAARADFLAIPSKAGRGDS
jgi:hypothetical protein